MRAAVLRQMSAPFGFTEVAEPRIGSDEVLVRTQTCGICRTDLHIQDGLAYIPHFPHVPGHEPAGIVEEVGSEVGSFKKGDRVVPHLFLTCGACRYCRSRQEAQCLNVRGVIGVTTPGGFAEYFKAPARQRSRCRKRYRSAFLALESVKADHSLTADQMEPIHNANQARQNALAAAIAAGDTNAIRAVQLIRGGQ